MIGCIYKMTSPSGKVYIGQTTELLRRVREYTNLKCKSQVKVYNSLAKYGFDEHDFHVIDYCHISILNDRERYWQDHYNVIGKKGLNMRLTTSKNKSGRLSDDLRQRIGLSNLGKHNHDDRVKKLISEAHKGKTIPQWHKDHNSKLLKVKFIGKGNPFYGKTHKPENLELLSKRSSGGNNVKAKTFLNIETGVFYETLTEFALHIGVANPTAIKRIKENYYPNYKQV